MQPQVHFATMAFQRPFLIILKREEASQPWGFRVSGGADLAAPPRVEKVAEGSPAAQQGMHEGDLVIQVGKHNVQDLNESRINALLAQPAKRLEVFIVREDFLQKPRKGEPSTVKAVVHNQYNSPLQLYSQEKVAETLAYHAQAITAEDGVNNIQPVGLPQNLVRSAVLQALSEDEIGANPYRTANGTTVVQRATAPPPPPPKPRPPSYSGESPHTQRPHSSSGHHVTFATPGTPGTPPIQQPNFYVPPPPAPAQHYEQPSYQEPSYQQPSYQPPGQQVPSYQPGYPVQHARQSSYEEADRRQQLIQAAELRQRQLEEERQQQAQYEEGRFRQPPQDFRRAEYEAEQRRIREEEERRRRLFQDEESIRQRQQQQQEEQRRRLQQEEQQRQRRLELEEQERRRRQEQEEYEQYQRHQQQYQRYLEEQKRKDEELRRTEQQQQEAARRRQLEGQQRQVQQQRFQNAQREPLDVQRAQQEAQQRRYQPSSAVASSPQHQEQVGSQAQRWENRIWEEQQARMPGTPLGSPSVSRRARDNVWPPKESSVRWTPKTGFSPQLTRQSSQGAKQFVWPPPKSGMANGDDGGFPSRPPSRTAVNAWHPGSPTTGTRTPPFARSPSLGRRTRDIAWPPPQPESSPKFMPRPVSRTGLHRPDEFVHQNASCGVPPTYRPPPNSSQFV